MSEPLAWMVYGIIVICCGILADLYFNLRRVEVVDEVVGDWVVSHDAAGTWLRCLRELPEGGTVRIVAPTLQAIRVMELLDENWLEAAKKAAAP